MTKIEWVMNTDGSRGQTWNPIVGCSVTSPGCTNCYAMNMARRCEAMGTAHYAGTTKVVNGKAVWTGKVAMAPESTLLAPLRRRKPTTYFVNSMGDLFHEDVPDEWIDRVFAVMALCPQHTFQVLTKRSARMREYVGGSDVVARVGDAAHQMHYDGLITEPDGIKSWPLPNLWLGVSTEDQRRADERIPDLLATPAAVRFVSVEPLLGRINLNSLIVCNPREMVSATHGYRCVPDRLGEEWIHAGKAPRLDWVIVGGESGPGARPMHPDWARGLRDQCAAVGIPFLFKRWGDWVPEDQSPEDAILPGWARCPWAEKDRDGGWSQGDQTSVYRLGKRAAGRLLDGVEHNGMPEARHG